MRISFNVIRLLFAITVFSAVLAIFLWILPERNAINLFVSLGTATATALLVLVLRRSDWPNIKVEITCSIFGILMFFLLYPMPFYESEVGSYILYALTFAFLGWLFGGIYARWDESIATCNQQSCSAPELHSRHAEGPPTSDGGRAESPPSGSKQTPSIE